MSHVDSCQFESPSVPCAASLWDYLYFTGHAKASQELSESSSVDYHLWPLHWNTQSLCVFHIEFNFQTKLFKHTLTQLCFFFFFFCTLSGFKELKNSPESEHFFLLLLLLFTRCLSLTYKNSSPPADNSFTVSSNYVKNIWEKISPIWDYFELNVVNSDKAAGAFNFGREQIADNVVENLLKYLKEMILFEWYLKK